MAEQISELKEKVDYIHTKLNFMMQRQDEALLDLRTSLQNINDHMAATRDQLRHMDRDLERLRLQVNHVRFVAGRHLQ